MNRPHLFLESSRRCSKCMNIVWQVEQDESPHWTKYYGGEHLEWPRPVSVSAVRTEHYQPKYPCRNCSSHLQAGQYEKLGDHLVTAHDVTRDRITVSEKGCCYLCLLCLQLKCRNGFKSNSTQPVSENGQKNAFIDASESVERSDLQLFSDSIDGLVDIARYLPEGPKGSLLDWVSSMRIIPLQEIPYGTVESWLKTCEDNHGCDRKVLLLPTASANLYQTFIDVKRLCLVACEGDIRYIALSYVWGGISQLLLTKSNQELLFRDGSLLKLEREIPQVIKDAMKFVRNIGERYLWVDSLCIVQDDESIKHHLISKMGSIYNSAVATIVAASGEDATHGLPGVRENTRVLENSMEIPGTGLQMTFRRELDTIVDNSTYNARGWTFQERLLSRRCFYFTETQIFFECQRYVYSEDRLSWEPEAEEGNKIFSWETSSNLITKKLSRLDDTFGNQEEVNLLRYSGVVEEYCDKNFTFASDIVDAFAGIEAAMEELCGWTMLYGLPEQLLDRALLWEPQKEEPSREPFTMCSRLRDEHTKTTTSHKKELRSLEIPSWSWFAWTGSLRYDPWTASELQVFHTPLKVVHPSIPSASALAPKPKCRSLSRPSVLSFSSECLALSSFVLKNTNFRNRKTCWILNSEGQNVGVIPGVEAAFVNYDNGDLVDIVLLSASKLAVHRFRSEEDMGYPSFFSDRYPRSDWSVLTVMFVKWDNGYGKRIALGYIHKVAWTEAGPVGKPILLG